MKMIVKLFSLSACALGLAACQNMAQSYNGNSGYQLESQSANSAILSYTLALHANQDANEHKLQDACKKVLGSTQDYKIQILSRTEIPNPANQASATGVHIGKTNTMFQLSDAARANDDYAMRNTTQIRPSTLTVIRYQCSL